MSQIATRWLPRPRILPPCRNGGLTPGLGGGAECGSAARRDLCGGLRVTAVPTATDILTGFIAICKRLKIKPFTYLRDVFHRISAHPMNRLEELLPDNWQAAQAATQNLPA